MYTNWLKGWIYVYSCKTVPSTVCAPRVCVGSVNAEIIEETVNIKEELDDIDKRFHQTRGTKLKYK